MGKQGDGGDAETKSDVERNFETIARAIAYAAREQGPDPDDNLWLRCAMERAERANMEEHLIEQARARGAGETDDPPLEEVTFEGYGPGDVAVFVRSITESTRLTREELDEIFKQHGGNIGEDGCVAWQFDRRGLVLVDAASVDDEDAFTLAIIERGGDELGDPLYSEDEDRPTVYRVYCEGERLLDLAGALDEDGYRVRDLRWIRQPTQRVELSSDQARNFLAFNEKLSKRVDVQDVFSNWTTT